MAEVDAGVDNDVPRQIKMLKNSRDGLKAIRTHGTLKYCRVGIKSHLSMKAGSIPARWPSSGETGCSWQDGS